MQNGLEFRPLITKVWAKNFRSIEFAELDLSPLTVLVGPNASGKSNLMDVLRFVADASSDGLDTAITDRGGINSIGRRPVRGKAYDPEIGITCEDNESIIEYEFSISNRGGGEYQVKREYARWHSKKQGTEPIEIEVRNGRLTKPNLRQARRNSRRVIEQLNLLPALDTLETFRFNPKDLALPFDRVLFIVILVVTGEYGSISSALFTQFHKFLSDMRFYHIFPNLLRDPQKMGDRYPLEEHGNNLASVLRDMIQQKNPLLSELKAALTYVVPGVRDLKVTPAGGGYLVVELNHKDLASGAKNAWFDLSQESDGTLRLLGLLVALFQTPNPPLIAIEEPELTIHPGALAVLADIMQEATLRTQVLVTTHSPELIDRIPVEYIRAVSVEAGVTKVGMVAHEQREAVRKGLFSPGELHRIEGLQVATKES